MKKTFTSKDIDKIVNFQRRLNTKLGLRKIRRDWEHFLYRVYHSYKEPSGGSRPRDMSTTIFFSYSLSKRKELEKQYNLKILQKEWGSSIELSKIHKVKF